MTIFSQLMAIFTKRVNCDAATTADMYYSMMGARRYPRVATECQAMFTARSVPIATVDATSFSS